MKVLMVHNYYQQGGGEDKIFEAEASVLEEHGHQVTHPDSQPPARRSSLPQYISIDFPIGLLCSQSRKGACCTKLEQLSALLCQRDFLPQWACL
jgi:hypothetical protein